VLEGGSREVYDGQIGHLALGPDEAVIEIGADVAAISRHDFHDYELSDPLPGVEYAVRVQS
jgi:hypothetical protein